MQWYPRKRFQMPTFSLIYSRVLWCFDKPNLTKLSQRSHYLNLMEAKDGKESFARPWDRCKKACRGWYVTHNRLPSLTWRRSLCWCCRWSGAPSWVLQNPRVSTLAFEKTRQQGGLGGGLLDGEMPAPPLSHSLPDHCFTAVNMSASTYRNLNVFTVSGLLSLLSLISVWGIVKNG